MRLRVATTADARALARLRWEWRVAENPDLAAVEDHDAFVDRFVDFATQALDSGRWVAWVADHDGEIVANIWVHRVPKVPSPGRAPRDFGYMTNVYTTPHARDRSVGSELLEAVRAWAHEEDLEMVIVWPSEQSSHWYQRNGYAPSAAMLEMEISGYEG